MSEIAKCPRCGGTPKRIQYKAGGFGHICCGAEFFCTTHWNQYAAAMELAKACVAADAAMRADDDDDKMTEIYERFSNAESHVLEVFGK